MINWDRIEELKAEVGEDDLAEVLMLFCEEVEEVLECLPQAAQASLPGHLHFLKGSALNIGLEGVSQLCLEEEQKLSKDPTTALAFDAIREAYQASRKDLSALL